MKLKINEFLSISIQLLYESSKIINQVRQTTIHHKWKGHLDPVTNADFQSQNLIISGLRTFYPQLRIVAEEEEENIPQYPLPEFDYNKINLNLIPQTAFENNQIPLNNTTVWIDPLDSTISFLKGNYDAVTSLIGLSFLEKPVAGIICKPFTGNNIYNPRIYYGYVNSGKKEVYFLEGNQINENNQNIYQQKQKICIKDFEEQSSLQKLKVAISKDIEDPLQLDTIKQLQPYKIIPCGGSGRKALLILENQADYQIYLSNKASKWDICAPEALLKCLDGFLTDIHGNEYIYDCNQNNFQNSNGYIFCLRKDILQTILPKLKFYKIK